MSTPSASTAGNPAVPQGASMPAAPPEARQFPRTRSISGGLIVVGVVSLLTAAWGGIVPFIGPVFGYSADGTSSWYWSLPHALLWLVPGAAAVLASLIVLSIAPLTAGGRGRMELALMGGLIVLCGAWLVIGFVAWPVLKGSGVFVFAPPMQNLSHLIGYALGPGLLLVACGGFFIGWAMRHRGGLATYPTYPAYRPEPATAAAPAAPGAPVAPGQAAATPVDRTEVVPPVTDHTVSPEAQQGQAPAAGT